MTKEELITYWKNEYGLLPDEFRRDLPTRYSRRHYLPGGEQYPRHHKQYEQMLFRLNSILDYIFERERNIITIVTEWGPNDIAPANIDLRPYNLLREIWVRDEFCEDGQTDYKQYLEKTLHFLESSWQKGSQDEILRKVADEEISGVNFLNVNERWLACPYDGGIDVWAPNEEENKRFQIEFSDWAPFAGEIDKYEVARMAHPDERSLLHHLISLDASIYLNEDDKTYSLRISSSQVDDKVIGKISQLVNLEYLNIVGHIGNDIPSSVTDDGISVLFNLHKLKHLGISPEVSEVFPCLSDRSVRLIEKFRFKISEQ